MIVVILIINNNILNINENNDKKTPFLEIFNSVFVAKSI